MIADYKRQLELKGQQKVTEEFLDLFRDNRFGEFPTKDEIISRAIQLLRDSSDFRTKSETVQILKDLTGQDFGDDPDHWQAWWNNQR